MALNSTGPWKIHLSGAGSVNAGRQGWWARWKSRNVAGAHPALMKEQDLDHLGALHDTVPSAKRRKKRRFGG